MNRERIDIIAKLVAERRRSRREVAGARAANASGADTERGAAMLFVQSYQHGSIVAKTEEAGAYALTLDQGLGQTIYFSDRPDRTVGALPTPKFLDGLGFDPTNPPNAALVVDAGDGETDLAVLTLSNPSFDEGGLGVTFDVTVLADYRRSLEIGFTEQPLDLTTFPAAFGSAHLFIDGCRTGATIFCCVARGGGCASWPGEFTADFCFREKAGTCLPCEGSDPPNVSNPEPFAAGYWANQCNTTYAECGGACVATWTRSQP